MYVTDTENTVLGTVMVARKVEVTVQDRNQTIAALGEGSLSTGSGCDRPGRQGTEGWKQGEDF